MVFNMTSSCCTVVDRKDQVQYLQFKELFKTTAHDL